MRATPRTDAQDKAARMDYFWMHEHAKRLERELGATSELLFSYEGILKEMRTHAKAGGIIAEWVKRLDFYRDEAAAEIPSIQEKRT